MTGPATAFQLAVFDVAGTTVLDGDAVLDCLSQALETWITVEVSDVVAVMGLPKPVAIRQLLAASGAVDAADLDDAVDAAHHTFRASMMARYRSEPLAPAAGAGEVFAALRDAGVRVALDTGFSRDILDTVLGRLGWREGETVDVTIASDEVLHGRPHPDLIYRAMALTGVSEPARVAKIGDTPSDMAQGLAAGCGLVVGVTYGTHTRVQLEQHGVHVIDRLPDLLPLVAGRE